MERGVATSHSAPILQNDIVQSETDVYVWPFSKGQTRGLAIKPLSKNTPMAALKDRKLYDFLALLDALRIGKSRERNIAINKIKILIQRLDDNGKSQT